MSDTERTEKLKALKALLLGTSIYDAQIILRQLKEDIESTSIIS